MRSSDRVSKQKNVRDTKAASAMRVSILDDLDLLQ